MTVATADGEDEARRGGFRLLNATLGHVYTSKPSELHALTAPPRWRLAQAMALMQSGTPQ
jgi:hypothetical protein